MKKVVALCLCIVSLFVSIPVYAAECDDASEGRMYTVAELIPAEDGSATIVPYNVDLMPVSGPYWQNYVSVSKGKNMTSAGPPTANQVCLDIGTSQRYFPRTSGNSFTKSFFFLPNPSIIHLLLTPDYCFFDSVSQPSGIIFNTGFLRTF